MTRRATFDRAGDFVTALDRAENCHALRDPWRRDSRSVRSAIES